MLNPRILVSPLVIVSVRMALDCTFCDPRFLARCVATSFPCGAKSWSFSGRSNVTMLVEGPPP